MRQKFGFRAHLHSQRHAKLHYVKTGGIKSSIEPDKLLDWFFALLWGEIRVFGF